MRKISGLLSSLKPLQLIRAWNECAGPALLKQVRFLGVAIEEGVPCLRLEVPDPTWRQELEFQKEAILTAFNGKLADFNYPPSERPQRCRLVNVAGPGTATRNARAAKPRG